jgi:hypothetical protein
MKELLIGIESGSRCPQLASFLHGCRAQPRVVDEHSVLIDLDDGCPGLATLVAAVEEWQGAVGSSAAAAGAAGIRVRGVSVWPRAAHLRRRREPFGAPALRRDGGGRVRAARGAARGSHAGRGWVDVAVDDVDSDYERVRAAGANVVNEPHGAFDGGHSRARPTR